MGADKASIRLSIRLHGAPTRLVVKHIFSVSLSALSLHDYAWAGSPKFISVLGPEISSNRPLR